MIDKNKMLSKMKYKMMQHFILNIMAPYSLIIVLSYCSYTYYTYLDSINMTQIKVLPINIDMILILYFSIVLLIVRIFYFVFEKRDIEKLYKIGNKNDM